MFQLKEYQKKSLAALEEYLNLAARQNPKQAYDDYLYEKLESRDFPPYTILSESLKNIPYICLRLPTGGGKTLLSSYTVKLAAQSYLEKDFPLVLWMVPSDTIKQQTLETLKNHDHPNRKVLSDAFGHNVAIFDIDDFAQIRSKDISRKACIILTTFAKFRVTDTFGRKIYQHHENLEEHFKNIPLNNPRFEHNEKGEVKYSFANLLHHHRPLVIVDEAHNAKSDLSVEVLERISPACIVEYTATPANNSNILHHVSASELKAEEMIKLPIYLSEFSDWRSAITNAIMARNDLEQKAKTDKDYIRPIVLFQAESKSGEVTVDAVKKELIENQKIPASEIAIATGNVKELDNINLFDTTCSIRYIITVQALKEGWDCSFAYVLCSLANMKSTTAIEQILGRTLRMPYAKARQHEDLNAAYAFVSSPSWSNAVTKLTDCLVNMGFDKSEAYEYTKEPQGGLFGDSFTSSEPTIKIELKEKIDTSSFDMVEKKNIKQTSLDNGSYSLEIQNPLPQTCEKIRSQIKDKTTQKEFDLRVQKFNNTKEENKSPCDKGLQFSIPYLCININNQTLIANKENMLPDGWRLSSFDAILDEDEFSLSRAALRVAIDIDETGVFNEDAGNLEYNWFSDDQYWTENNLITWLDRNVQKMSKQKDIPQTETLAFSQKIIGYLITHRGIELKKLILNKYPLAKAVKAKIDSYRNQAYKTVFQQNLDLRSNGESIYTIDLSQYRFDFPSHYPAHRLYNGRHRFKKHYHSLIADMNEEEIECAKAIDRNSDIDYWIRNLEKDPKHAFWLPTSENKFFPDFIAKLKDGRIFVIEYKGAHLLNKEDTKAKAAIGEVWAKESGNLFLLADKNMDLYHELEVMINA